MIGFELGLFFCPASGRNFSYFLVHTEFAIRLRQTRLGLFCIKRSICREFSTDVEENKVPKVPKVTKVTKV